MVHAGPKNRHASCSKAMERASHSPLLLVRGDTWRRKDGPSVTQAVVFLPGVSVVWTVMAYKRGSNLWKGQPTFFAQR